MSFNSFKNNIKNLGGVFLNNNVIYREEREGYYASYNPEFPKVSNLDITIFQNRAEQYKIVEYINAVNGLQKLHRQFENFDELKECWQKYFVESGVLKEHLSSYFIKDGNKNNQIREMIA